jgi:hypothetical protein
MIFEKKDDQKVYVYENEIRKQSDEPWAVIILGKDIQIGFTPYRGKPSSETVNLKVTPFLLPQLEEIVNKMKELK